MESSRDSHESRSSRLYEAAESNCHTEDDVEVLRPVNHGLRVAMDSYSYYLADTSPQYDIQVPKRRPQIDV